jgi:hypothetical protein
MGSNMCPKLVRIIGGINAALKLRELLALVTHTHCDMQKQIVNSNIVP